MLSLSFPLAVSAQTLASPPPGAAKAATAAPKKQAEPALAAKVNALIKGQPTASAASPKPVASPASAAAAPPVQATAQPAASQAPAAEAPKLPAPSASAVKIDNLITEREQLVLKYDYLKTQGNNFWGKASKEDMRAVIEALKEVLQKDEQIIHAVEQANLETRRSVAKRAAELEAEARKLNSQVQGDKRVVTDNIYELKASLANAQNLNRRRDRQIKDLEERLEAANDAKFEHDGIAAFLGMFSLVLIGLIVRLRSQVSELKKQKQHANA